MDWCIISHRGQIGTPKGFGDLRKDIELFNDTKIKEPLALPRIRINEWCTERNEFSFENQENDLKLNKIFVKNFATSYMMVSKIIKKK